MSMLSIHKQRKLRCLSQRTFARCSFQVTCFLALSSSTFLRFCFFSPCIFEHRLCFLASCAGVSLHRCNYKRQFRLPLSKDFAVEVWSYCFVSTSLKLETEGSFLLLLYLFVVVVVYIVHVSTVTLFLHEEMLKPGYSKQVVKLSFL